MLRVATTGDVRVTLHWHNKDLKRGTLRSVIEQAGFTTDEFAELL
jgi:predicted RNA binding protein YcfA (HicA-like mRNA interferase family)